MATTPAAPGGPVRPRRWHSRPTPLSAVHLGKAQPSHFRKRSIGDDSLGSPVEDLRRNDWGLSGNTFGEKPLLRLKAEDVSGYQKAGLEAGISGRTVTQPSSDSNQRLMQAFVDQEPHALLSRVLSETWRHCRRPGRRSRGGNAARPRTECSGSWQSREPRADIVERLQDSRVECQARREG